MPKHFFPGFLPSGGGAFGISPIFQLAPNYKPFIPVYNESGIMIA